MTIKAQLSEIIQKWNLLNSRFYQSWNAGELPRDGLAKYAEEYGAFIQLLPQGWVVLNDEETVEEEREHAELWSEFASAFDTQIGAAQNPKVVELVNASRKLFATKASSLGAMYAFEVQQPETACTKLEGINKFYPVSNAAKEYFEVHSKNHHESEKLLGWIEQLADEDQKEALKACGEMSKALWDALEGIYDEVM